MQEYTFYQERYAITVCRIEPENNIHCLLEAFARQTKIPLVIVGDWKSSDYGLMLLEKYRANSNIHLLGPIYNSEKINFLRSNAFVYIHGHSAGGTNPSLVEAMFLELPVFAFDCVYNRYTTENRCLYWSNVDELYRYIIHHENVGLDEIGANLKQIAEKRYRWKNIVSRYEALFRSFTT